MTAALESSPSSSAPSLRRVTNPNGNPTLNLSPRCGARTRAGCPCQAPAMRGKLRCRRHGGCSTGPRTDAGLARVSAARSMHGQYGAAARAYHRWTITLQRRVRVGNAAARLFEKLPGEFQARLLGMAPELTLPPRPAAGLTEAEDRAARRAEAAALAPWRAVIAVVRSQQGKKAEEGPYVPVGGMAGPALAVNLEERPRVPVDPSGAAGRASRGSAAALPTMTPGEDVSAHVGDGFHGPVEARPMAAGPVARPEGSGTGGRGHPKFWRKDPLYPFACLRGLS